MQRVEDVIRVAKLGFNLLGRVRVSRFVVDMKVDSFTGIDHGL